MNWPETACAYLAGLVDGEGCIGVYLKRRKSKPSYSPLFQVTNTNLRILSWCVEIFGGAIDPVKTKQGSKQTYIWRPKRIEEAQNILLAIRPYLVAKGRQADLVLRFPVRQNLNRWTSEKTKEVAEIKSKLYEQTLVLNGRGV